MRKFFEIFQPCFKFIDGSDVSKLLNKFVFDKGSEEVVFSIFEVLEREIANPEWFKNDVLENYSALSLNTKGYTLVHHCLKAGYVNLVNIFIERYGFDVDFYVPNENNTLLHVWC